VEKKITFRSDRTMSCFFGDRGRSAGAILKQPVVAVEENAGRRKRAASTPYSCFFWINTATFHTGSRSRVLCDIPRKMIDCRISIYHFNIIYDMDMQSYRLSNENKRLDFQKTFDATGEL
jgi:hypothetical protein